VHSVVSLSLINACLDIEVKECLERLHPTGYFMYGQFNVHQFYVLPTLYLCVLCGSQNKQPLFLYTTLTDWFL